MSGSRIEIAFALPINSENRWSDVLAVLVATDPAPICAALRLDVDPGEVTIERETVVDSANRPDVILRAGERTLAVIEVKVLAGLGPKQLERYEAVEPNAERYVVVHPERLAVDTTHAAAWTSVSWETLLGAYTSSAHPWVQATAAAWLEHLDGSLPKVTSDTRWGDLVDGEPFVIAMRTRASWVHSNLVTHAPVEHDLVASAAGASAVVRIFAEAQKRGYWVMAEVEERMPVRAIPKYANQATHPLLGPSIKVVLLQTDVDTSAGFDWDYLLAMWPLMAAARTDWVTRSAAPKHAHDRANHQAMVAKGGPKHLGFGFGEAQTRISRQCMFGARFQLPPEITLGALVGELEQLAELVTNMSQVPVSETGVQI